MELQSNHRSHLASSGCPGEVQQRLQQPGALLLDSEGVAAPVMGFCTIALTAVFILIYSLNLVRFFGFRHLCLKYITNSLAEYYNIYRVSLLGPLILE